MSKFEIPLIMTDGYKVGHHLMYPENMTLVFSNFTPRNVKYMHEKAKDIIVFGIQYTLKRITDLFDEEFFMTKERKKIKEKYSLTSQFSNSLCEREIELLRDKVMKGIKDELSSYTSSDYDITHFEKLWDLGYLPIEVRSLEEGTKVPVGVPILTYYNTSKEFFWVTNFLETLISAELWKPLHSASVSFGAKKLVRRYMLETDMDNSGAIDFQNHDFSFRGMHGLESAISSSMGFLTSSLGTDTVPAIGAIKYYYGTSESAFSVFATEHAVQTAYGKETEIDGFSRILDVFPNGIVSMVSDSYDFFKVHTETIYELKDKILARDGKTVFRGDSGDPVDIICGLNATYQDISEHFPKGTILSEYFEEYLLEEVRSDTPHGVHGVESYEQIYKVNGEFYKAKIHNISWNRHDKQYYYIDMFEKSEITFEKLEQTPEMKGQIELLWECFGGTVNDQGYKVLNPKVGAIYGDGINFDRAELIMKRLEQKGFASTNIVFGWGSYSMGYATRDNQGSAVKATYIERVMPKPKFMGDNNVEIQGFDIFKEPKTDMGKKSAKGLLRVVKDTNGNIVLEDQSTWDKVNSDENLLKLTYRNGKLLNEVTFDEIRERITKHIVD